jgi:hypothetical protein
MSFKLVIPAALHMERGCLVVYEYNVPQPGQTSVIGGATKRFIPPDKIAECFNKFPHLKTPHGLLIEGINYGMQNQWNGAKYYFTLAVNLEPDLNVNLCFNPRQISFIRKYFFCLGKVFNIVANEARNREMFEKMKKRSTQCFKQVTAINNMLHPLQG